MKIARKQLLAEIAGWYGTAAILIAYALVSFRIIASDNVLFQLLNLTGAFGIMIIAIYKKVGQSIVLNVVWALVAITALIGLLL